MDLNLGPSGPQLVGIPNTLSGFINKKKSIILLMWNNPLMSAVLWWMTSLSWTSPSKMDYGEWKMTFLVQGILSSQCSINQETRRNETGSQTSQIDGFSHDYLVLCFVSLASTLFSTARETQTPGYRDQIFISNGTMHLARPQINNKILEQFKSGF